MLALVQNRAKRYLNNGCASSITAGPRDAETGNTEQLLVSDGNTSRSHRMPVARCRSARGAARPIAEVGSPA